MNNFLFNILHGDGKTLRDQGIAQVAARNHDWIEHGLLLIRKYVSHGQEFMAERFRSLPGIGQPTHPNAWGALTRAAISRGLIVAIPNRFDQARGASVHAHRYAVYRRV